MKAVINWVPSVSLVVEQNLVVKINNVVVVDDNLASDVSSAEVGVNPGDVVDVELDAVNDFGLRSTKVFASATAPTAPEAPTGLAIDFVQD